MPREIDKNLRPGGSDPAAQPASRAKETFQIALGNLVIDTAEDITFGNA